MSGFNRIFFIPFACFIVFCFAAYGIGGVFTNSKIIKEVAFRGEWPLNHKPGLVLLTACQGALILAAIPGIIGVLRRSIVILFVPSFIYLGILSTLIIMGCISLRDSSKDITHEIMNYLIKSRDLTWLSEVQWENECCGVKSYMDYYQLNFKELNNQSVPFSCCKRSREIPKQNCGIDVLEPRNNLTDIERDVSTKGCNSFIMEAQSEILKSLGIEMILIGVISGLIAAFLYWGLISIINQEANRADAEAPRNQTGEDEDVSRARRSPSWIALQSSRLNRLTESNLSLSSINDTQNNNPFQPALQSTITDEYQPKIMKPTKRLKKIENNSAFKGTHKKSKKKYATLPNANRKSTAKRANPNVELLFKPINSLCNTATPSTSKSQDFMQNFRQLQLGLGYIKTLTENDPTQIQNPTQKSERAEYGYSNSSSVPVFSNSLANAKPSAESSKRILPKSRSPNANRETCSELPKVSENKSMDAITEYLESVVQPVLENNMSASQNLNTMENPLPDSLDEPFTESIIEPGSVVVQDNLIQESGEMIGVITESTIDDDIGAVGGTEEKDETLENIVENESIETEVYVQV